MLRIRRGDPTHHTESARPSTPWPEPTPVSEPDIPGPDEKSAK